MDDTLTIDPPDTDEILVTWRFAPASTSAVSTPRFYRPFPPQSEIKELAVTTAVPPRRWATKPQAAQHVGVHPDTIDAWVAGGLIVAYRFGPRILRYDLNELDAMSTPTTPAEAAAQ